MAHIGSLPPGLYEVSIKPRKRTRSFKANKYYFVAVAAPFAEWLRREWGDPSVTSEDAHEILKVKILGWDERLIEGTNETIKRIPRSRSLTPAEFGTLVDQSAAWLAEFCGIVVLPPELFYESKEKA